MIPAISIVMSVYNAEQFLEEAIQSVLNQTFKDFEFIIINDGSNDGSLQIIENYKDRDRRIVLVSRENRGLIESLNEGLSMAQGKYIARMDADDISLPLRLEKQFDFMEKNQDIGLSGTWIEAFNETGLRQIGRYPYGNEMIKAELLFSSPFAHPSVIMRRGVLDEYHLSYNRDYPHAEDYELWYQCSKVTQLANIPHVLLRYRVLPDSITRKADKDNASRENTLKSIYTQILDSLGIKLTKDELKLHYTLTLNTRIAKNHQGTKVLSSYFNKLMSANQKMKIFDANSLLQVLGKKWLWNLMFHAKKHPETILKSMFSKYFYFGLLAVYNSRKKQSI